MAEGGDTGEFKGTIAGQAVGFSTNNLTQTLLILLLGVLGWLIWTQLDKRLETAGRVLVEHSSTLAAHHVKFFEMLQGNRENTHEEIAVVLRHIAIANWNCTHPEEQQIPLGVNGAPPAKPPAP